MKGRKSLSYALRRDMTGGDMRVIVRKLLDMARAGDLQAIRLIFERHDDASTLDRLTTIEEALNLRT